MLPPYRDKPYLAPPCHRLPFPLRPYDRAWAGEGNTFAGVALPRRDVTPESSTADVAPAPHPAGNEAPFGKIFDDGCVPNFSGIG